MSLEDEIVGLLRELTEAQKETSARITAMRAALVALIRTNPNPQEAMESYLELMDLTADATQPDRIGLYSPDMQAMLQAFSHATRRTQGR